MKPEIETTAAGEVWKPITGYDGAYQVSNMGRVKSVARLTTRPCQYGIREYRIPERIMRTRLGTRGYLCVNLHHEGKQVTEMIHRLVALHFCKGYADGMSVNHIDEVKTNNRADNLEWVTTKENNNHGTRTERATAHCRAIRRGVVQIDLDGNDIQAFNSARHAEKVTGISSASIYNACVGKTKTAKGYRWRYSGA